MKKNEFVKKITEEVKATGAFAVSQRETDAYLEALKHVVMEALAEGDEVSIQGFLKFTTADQAARVGRNPATGETIEIPEKKKVKVKILGDLKSCLE